MTFTELLAQIKKAPIICGSCDIGWTAKYHKETDKYDAFCKVDFPPGTPYKTVVESIQKAIKS